MKYYDTENIELFKTSVNNAAYSFWMFISIHFEAWLFQICIGTFLSKMLLYTTFDLNVFLLRKSLSTKDVLYVMFDLKNII